MKKLLKELDDRAEFWRTTKEDPHGIATAVYVALMEVRAAIRDSEGKGRKKRLNARKQTLSE